MPLSLPALMMVARFWVGGEEEAQQPGDIQRSVSRQGNETLAGWRPSVVARFWRSRRRCTSGVPVNGKW